MNDSIDVLVERMETEWNPDEETLDEYRKRKHQEWERFFDALDCHE